jgi:hypothetical protein
VLVGGKLTGVQVVTGGQGVIGGQVVTGGQKQRIFLAGRFEVLELYQIIY